MCVNREFSKEGCGFVKMHCWVIRMQPVYVERGNEGRLERPSTDSFKCQMQSLLWITNEAHTAQRGDKSLESLTPDGSVIIKTHYSCSSSATFMQQRSNSEVLSQEEIFSSMLCSTATSRPPALLIAPRASHMLSLIWSYVDGAQAQVPRLLTAKLHSRLPSVAT